jgi:hypothetical protein
MHTHNALWWARRRSRRFPLHLILLVIHSFKCIVKLLHTQVRQRDSTQLAPAHLREDSNWGLRSCLVQPECAACVPLQCCGDWPAPCLLSCGARAPWQDRLRALHQLPQTAQSWLVNDSAVAAVVTYLTQLIHESRQSCTKCDNILPHCRHLRLRHLLRTRKLRNHHCTHGSNQSLTTPCDGVSGRADHEWILVDRASVCRTITSRTVRSSAMRSRVLFACANRRFVSVLEDGSQSPLSQPAWPSTWSMSSDSGHQWQPTWRLHLLHLVALPCCAE